MKPRKQNRVPAWCRTRNRAPARVLGAAVLAAACCAVTAGASGDAPEDADVAEARESAEGAPATQAAASSGPAPVRYGPTPLLSDPEAHAKVFHLPAPRSLIVSREGVPLAVNHVMRRVVMRLPEVASTPAEAVAAVRSLREHFAMPPGADEDAEDADDPATERDGPEDAEEPALAIPLLPVDEARIARHFTHRPWIPLPVSGALSEEDAAALESALPRGCALDTLYRRSYPEGDLFAHLIGYIGASLPDQHGPVGKIEYAWPPTEGRAGMEMALNERLRGTDGEVVRLHDAKGALRHEEVARPPRPGDTMVLSVHMEMQRLAREALEATGRPGAFVAVDADTGDILAMVSYPSFDPNLFIGGISSEDYRELAEGAEAPLFDRAVTGAYPPGSTFKPFVALAGMKSGHIDGLRTRYPGPTVMVIAGRPFRNWSAQAEGAMDLRYALTRSCNTWFYQAALEMGAAPIADLSTRFGFGTAPDVPLHAVTAGNIPEPETYNDPRSLANFAIGQGRVLVSPLQMALAMAGLAHGSQVPRPRLVVETLDPLTGEISEHFDPSAARRLGLAPDAVEYVQEGLWGAVNHGAGTARGASMRLPVVYAKTGTSQWSSEGQRRSLAWFAGWVDAENPRIAFAAVSHGRRGERLSGSRSAAPIASRVLRTAYADPETYAVTLPEAPSRATPALVAALPIKEELEFEDFEARPLRRGGLLRFLFGGGRR